MKAMIFAAGLGTRLKPLTDTMPKALVPVCGKPLIQHVTEKLADAGFSDLVVNVHHFADQLEFWCHAVQLQTDAMTFTISDERKELLETGGAIKHARELLSDTDRFLIHNVDILSNVDLQAFWKAGEEADATLLVSKRDTQRYLLFDDDMRLVGWTNIKTGEVRSPYPDLDAEKCQRLAFAGIHQMSTSLLPLMEAYPDKFSIIDFYLQQCDSHLFRGYIQPDLKLMDVGKIDTLSQAEEFVNI